MIYSNDEGDKSIRQRNFLLTCIALPILAAAGVAGLLYKASQGHFLNARDITIGYVFSINLGMLLYGFNKRNWLKVPGRGWCNVKGQQYNSFSTKEPAEYDEVFYQSKKDKAAGIAIGLFVLVAAVFLLSKGALFIAPAVMIITAAFLIFVNVKRLLDKLPQLKLAKQGLWTKKLGFVEWKNIEKAEVVEEKGKNNSPSLWLRIHLKNTIFAEAGKPDETLNLNGLENKEMVETVIYQFIRQQAEAAG